MALLDTPKGKSVVAILVAVLLGYMVYTGEGLQLVGIEGLSARRAHVQAVRDSIALLQAQTDSVKRDLARGSIEDLTARTEQFRQVLEALRQLVPDRTEVPGLIDAIHARAKIRGVNLANFEPQPVQAGPPPFDTYRYRLAVIGRYDQIGEFMADVAGLRRIIVPMEVSLAKANPTSAAAFGDTSGAMLQASFQVKTYVKSAAAEGAGRGN